MASSIFERLQAICADLFHVPAQSIVAETSPESIEGWDSVQHLNLVLALEQEFDLQFEPEEIDRMKNVGAIAALLESKASGKP